MERLKLGQSDLVRLILVLAIPGNGKLGQVDLINFWPGDCLFGWTQNSTPVKGKVFPYLPGFSVHLSTDGPGLTGIENKGDQ